MGGEPYVWNRERSNRSVTVNVFDPDGNCLLFQLKVLIDHTIGTVKRKISTLEAQRKTTKEITFRGRVLKDEEVIRHLNVRDNDKFYLRMYSLTGVKCVRLLVAEDTALWVTQNSSLHKFKKIFSDYASLPLDSFVLYFKGREIQEGDTAELLGMKSNDKIQVKKL